nr:SIS domain-containing protein [bacterium]
MSNHPIMLDEIRQQPQVLRRAFEENAPIIRELAQQFIAHRPTLIAFCARGSSEHACLMARYLFETYAGVPTTVINPSVYTRYGAPVNFKGAWMIGVSQSGGAADVAHVLGQAGRSGALTLSITNAPDSIVEKAALHRMHCCCGEEKCVTATKSYLSQAALMAALAAACGEGLKADIDALPGAVEAALGLEDQVIAAARQLAGHEEIFLLARGHASTVCKEMELKLQEACAIHAHGYAVSDYIHGPFALTGPRMAYIMIAADPATDEETLALYQRMKAERGIKALGIGPAKQAGQFDSAIVLPDHLTGLPGTFAAAVILQLLTCHIALCRGLNPDHPEGVSKHTVTL